MVMAHAIENVNGKDCMFYVDETPWHGLGQKLDENPSISEAISAAGLDWRVGTKDLFTAEGERVNAKATYRESDNKVLGVVGPRYTPLQNQDAFDWFQPFLDAGECGLHTAGSLHNGEKVWVLAKLDRDNSEIVKGDETAKFILLSNSHDGTTAIRVGYSFIRVVCANTLAFAHSKNSGNKLIRIRHTRSSKTNLENIRDIMDNINADFEATAEQYRFLASKNFNQNDVRQYVKTVLGLEKTPDEDIKTRTKNIMDEILSLIDGPKQSATGTRGTYWAAWMGYNEYLNYHKGRTADNRMDSLWFGQGANDDMYAFNKAMEFASAV
jgi:phage/plasmid-like protein (TIGR03299 family)